MAEQIDGYRLVGRSNPTKMDAKLNEYVTGADAPEPGAPLDEQPEPFNPTVQPKNVVKKKALYGGVLRTEDTSATEESTVDEESAE